MIKTAGRITARSITCRPAVTNPASTTQRGIKVVTQLGLKESALVDSNPTIADSVSIKMPALGIMVGINRFMWEIKFWN